MVGGVERLGTYGAVADESVDEIGSLDGLDVKSVMLRLKALSSTFSETYHLDLDCAAVAGGGGSLGHDSVT